MRITEPRWPTVSVSVSVSSPLTVSSDMDFACFFPIFLHMVREIAFIFFPRAEDLFASELSQSSVSCLYKSQYKAENLSSVPVLVIMSEKNEKWKNKYKIKSTHHIRAVVLRFVSVLCRLVSQAFEPAEAGGALWAERNKETTVTVSYSMATARRVR